MGDVYYLDDLLQQLTLLKDCDLWSRRRLWLWRTTKWLRTFKYATLVVHSKYNCRCDSILWLKGQRSRSRRERQDGKYTGVANGRSHKLRTWWSANFTRHREASTNDVDWVETAYLITSAKL